MKPAKWPFSPIHITNDGEEQRERNLTKLTGVGIIPNEYLQGIQTSISASLNSPTTIIEFSPEGEAIRTDSRRISQELRPPCFALRYRIDPKYCLACDNAHALLFYNLNKSGLESKFNERVKSNQYIQDYKYKPGVTFKLQANKQKNRNYLEYDCPLLGYRELLFPLFFEDKVIAAFFTGQIVLPDKLEFIDITRNQFFQKYSAEIPTSAKIEVLEAHSLWAGDSANILDRKNYYALIQKVCDEINNFEKTLHEQMQIQKESFVRPILDREIQEFNLAIPTELPSGDGGLGLLWDNLEKRLENLVRDFNLKYIVIFGTSNLSGLQANVLNVVAQAGDISADLTTSLDSLKYDLSQITQDIPPSPITSVEHKELFNGIQGLAVSPNNDSHRLSIYPVPFQSSSSTVVLVGYHSSNSGTSPENQRGGHVDVALQSLFIIVPSVLSSILAASAKEKMKRALQVFGHELRQLTIGLDFLRSTYLSNPNEIKNLPPKKIDDIRRDIEGYLRQIYFIHEQANMTISTRPLKKTVFLAYRELLFKWRDTYRLESERECIQFEIPHPTNTPISYQKRPPVYGDKALLEQLVYNLVNNAVKYCYRGTKIHMDCVKQNAQPNSPHILTVTNYGIELVGGDKIYDLYYRGSNVAGREGLGIGLHVAKQIAEDHGGHIDASCVSISDFQVPLIEPYLKLSSEESNLTLRLREERERLSKLNQYNNIVALDQNMRLRYSNPTKWEVLESINCPTYRVTFTVIIPAKEVMT